MNRSTVDGREAPATLPPDPGGKLESLPPQASPTALAPCSILGNPWSKPLRFEPFHLLFDQAGDFVFREINLPQFDAQLQGHLPRGPLPDENAWGVPAGTYSPCFADGWFAILPPMKKGKPTVTNAMPPLGEGAFVTYEITVTAGE